MGPRSRSRTDAPLFTDEHQIRGQGRAVAVIEALGQPSMTARSAPTIAAVPRSETARDDTQRSALELALERVGDRWSLLIVDALLDGPRRFNELQDAVAGIAPNILTDRLRRLEREGILLARPYSERPPRLEYGLTSAGRDLAGALRLLADWGARRSDQHEPMRHALCGTPLEARWYCPTCTVLVDEPAASEARLV
jgi:DNA-binding HxlR family transcriptional regulator